MPKVGLAAIRADSDRPRFELREYPVVDAWPGSIRIKVSVANVCGSDIHSWLGHMKAPVATGGAARSPIVQPTVGGHEMMGIVDQLGDGVTTDSDGAPLAVGDRVVYGYTFPCRRCPYCRTGRSTWCSQKGPHKRISADVAPHFNGAFAQYFFLWPNHFVYKCPDAIADPFAATLNCAMAQVIYGVEEARIGLGDRAVVQGAGGLGLLATAVLRERGAGKIVVIDGVPERLELAESFGAHELIDMRELPDSDARVKRIWELTDGWGANVAFDFVGLPPVMLEGLQMLGNGGRYLEIGNINAGTTCEFEPNLLVRRHLSITGMLQYEPRHLKQAVDFAVATQARYPYNRLMAFEFPLTEINRAFDEQSTGKIPRAALRPWE